jgi:hypothetical protein
LFEPIEGEGFDELDIDAYSGARSHDTDDPVAGVGNVEGGAVRKKGFFPVRVLEAAQVRGMAGFFECGAQENFPQECGMGILPSPEFSDAFVKSSGKQAE